VVEAVLVTVQKAVLVTVLVTVLEQLAQMQE